MSFFTRLFRKPSSSLNTNTAVVVPPKLLRRNSTPAEIPRSSEERSSTDDPFNRHDVPVRRAALDSKQPCSWLHARKSVDFLESALFQAGLDSSAFPTFSNFVHLHTGRRASLVLAEDRTVKKKVVLKVYRREGLPPSELESIKSEIRLLRLAHGHTGVLRLESTVENAVLIALVTEKCSGGTLMEHISKRAGKIGEVPAGAELVPQLLQTLSHLHSVGIVHRNLKPEHIIRSESCWKLIDFSGAASLRADHLNYRVGTLQYMAPEVLDKPTAEEVFHEVILKGMSEEELPCYSEKSDIWSLGVVLYEALTGTYPFNGETAPEMLHAIHAALDGGFHQTIFQQCNPLSPECKDFLLSMLVPQPELRLSAADLLKHPWLAKCWEHLHPRVEQPKVDLAQGPTLAITAEDAGQFRRILNC